MRHETLSVEGGEGAPGNLRPVPGSMARTVVITPLRPIYHRNMGRTTSATLSILGVKDGSSIGRCSRV